MIKKQRGVTLIEIMISMMLGLALVAGIGQLFIQSQKSFTLQRNVSDMTNDASFILESLAKGLLLAGYSDSGDTNYGSSSAAVLSSSPALKFDSPCVLDTTTNTTKCEFIKGDDNSLIYRYRYGDTSGTAAGIGDTLQNFVCTSSMTANINDMVLVYIYKKNDTDGIPVFYCRAETYSPPATAPASTPNAQPLISDVEKLVFKYGIHNKTTNTFYYTDAATVTTDNQWLNVFAVKVFLVMRSADDNLVRVQKGYQIDGVDANPAPTDKRLYKTFSKTIFLRATDY